MSNSVFKVIVFVVSVKRYGVHKRVQNVNDKKDIYENFSQTL